MRPAGWLSILPVLTLVAACSPASGPTTTGAPESTATTLITTTTAGGGASTTAAAEEEGGLRVGAPVATITVDGDPSDWEGVPGLDVTLEPLVDEAKAHDTPATLKIARDDTNVYVLFMVQDDYDWNPDDPHLSGSAAVMFRVGATAGEHMGVDDPTGAGPSLGMVDIWHWELECPAGTPAGGAVNPPGEGHDPGNDSGCNLDDEWSTDPTTRGDDNGSGAENSILGVWSHSNPVAGGEGTWYFEFSRPRSTGDEQDADLGGPTAKVALAYWDPDNSPDGWEGDEHVMTSNQGWITVDFAG